MPAQTPQTPPALSLVPAAYVLLLRQAPAGRAGVRSPTAGPSGLLGGQGAQASCTQVLLQLRQHTGYMDGYWACGVAGHVEPGESVLETAVREAKEEVGVVVAHTDLEPLTTVHRSNDVAGPGLEQRVDFFFALHRWEGRPRVREPARTAALDWFALTSLPRAVPEHERHVLRLLADALDRGQRVPPVTTFGFDPGQETARYGTARPH
ncbi:NUDIX domain-containing protein [Actinomyces sp. 2119]|uniref:NUDIX domain-containing protein n=1 Tax=Actinomyces lilanjuaniae TaxID=2321394 RepID=A0ABM6Z5F4_9ACTO|nr:MULTISPECIES: NUDIX domain-containing protein [Actinomyces]AYD90331.1 NUDIX domain-containing protein [Actinomyces lilanjuaniae]RJF40904.1 NUDIX domain-containing protein [Actinomyces sp. 2119]